MKYTVLPLIVASLCLSACGKSKEEIELEREKIALQREMIKQKQEEKEKTKAIESKTAEPPAAPVVQVVTAPANPVPQPQQAAQVVNNIQQPEIKRVSKGVMTSNVKQSTGDSLLRSLQEKYRDNESILCGEYMVENKFKRFVFVQTYNSQQGTWSKNFIPDHDYSSEYTQNIWNEYCR